MKNICLVFMFVCLASMSFATDLQDAIKRQSETRSKNPDGYAYARAHLISYSVISAEFADNKVIIKAKATVKETYYSYVDFLYRPHMRVYRDGMAYGGYDSYNGNLEVKTIQKRAGDNKRENYFDYEYTFIDYAMPTGSFTHNYTIAWHSISQHCYLTELLACESRSVSGTVLSAEQLLLRDNSSGYMDLKMNFKLCTANPDDYEESNMNNEVQYEFDERGIIFHGPFATVEDAKKWKHAVRTGYIDNPDSDFLQNTYIDALLAGEILATSISKVYKHKYVQLGYELCPFTLAQSLMLNYAKSFADTYVGDLNKNKSQYQAICNGLVDASKGTVVSYLVSKLKIDVLSKKMMSKGAITIGKLMNLGRGLNSPISQIANNLAVVGSRKLESFFTESVGKGVLFSEEYLNSLKFEFKGTPVTDRDEYFPDGNQEIQAEYHLSEEVLEQLAY